MKGTMKSNTVREVESIRKMDPRTRECVGEEPPIHRAISEVDKIASVVEESIERLQSRLGAVLMPTPALDQTNGNSLEVPEPVTSDVERRLGHIQRRLISAARVVDDLNERLRC